MWPEGRKQRPWPLGEVVGDHSNGTDLQSHLHSSGFSLDYKHAQGTSHAEDETLSTDFHAPWAGGGPWAVSSSHFQAVLV